MNGYFGTTKTIDLGTLAADSCIFSLTNPGGANKKTLVVKRLTARCVFIGTPGSTKISFGLTRATGTAAGGTGSASGSIIGKRNPGNANATALLRWGPAPITGLTPDSVNDIKTFIMTHQLGAPQNITLIDSEDAPQNSDPLVLSPGTSLAVYNRDISVAGSYVALNIEWSEQ